MPRSQPPRDRRGQRDLIAFLKATLDDGHGCTQIDTHAARLFIAGDRAWKLKRAVKYPYLDFSTPPLRRAALEAELRLNRRTAPDMYLAVHPIVQSGESFRIGGDGEPVDWLLEMRRIPDQALLTDVAEAGRLDITLITRLADQIHSFHDKAGPVRREHGANDVRHIIDGNADSLARFTPIFGRARVLRLIDSQRKAAERHAVLLDRRARMGFVRRTHGDLHLANIAVINRQPLLFDCLEFSDELATTDTLYDVAFLLMDLWHKGLTADANILFNRYIDVAADEEGVRLLPLFMSMRATVRAHVLAATAEQHAPSSNRKEALRFLALAEALLEPGLIALMAIGGLSGTGKSAVARAIAGAFGRAPGARVLRTDVLRKRLARVPPEQKLAESFYSPLANDIVYDLICDHASAHLSSGNFVIVDAVLARNDERERIDRVAMHARVPFIGCWLEAPEATRLARVAKRAGDASDADVRVVRLQSSRPMRVPSGWHAVSTDASLAQVISKTRAIVEQALTGPHRAG